MGINFREVLNKKIENSKDEIEKELLQNIEKSMT